MIHSDWSIKIVENYECRNYGTGRLDITYSIESDLCPKHRGVRKHCQQLDDVLPDINDEASEHRSIVRRQVLCRSLYTEWFHWGYNCTSCLYVPAAAISTLLRSVSSTCLEWESTARICCDTP